MDQKITFTHGEWTVLVFYFIFYIILKSVKSVGSYLHALCQRKLVVCIFMLRSLVSEL